MSRSLSIRLPLFALPLLAPFLRHGLPRRNRHILSGSRTMAKEIAGRTGHGRRKLQEAIEYAQAHGSTWDFEKDQVRTFGTVFSCRQRRHITEEYSVRPRLYCGGVREQPCRTVRTWSFSKSQVLPWACAYSMASWSLAASMPVRPAISFAIVREPDSMWRFSARQAMAQKRPPAAAEQTGEVVSTGIGS